MSLLFCVCVGGGQGARRSSGGAEERGGNTHANERDKLLIRVFIRAVGRDREVLQLLGEMAWRTGDLSFSHFIVASRESKHYMTSCHHVSGWHGEPQKGGKRPNSAHYTSAPTSELQSLDGFLCNEGTHVGKPRVKKRGTGWEAVKTLFLSLLFSWVSKKGNRAGRRKM